jgi:hypothetical protein
LPSEEVFSIVLELCEKLRHESAEKDKYRSLLRELLEAQRNRKSRTALERATGLIRDTLEGRRPLHER